MTNGQADRGASPLKTERDHGAIFRRVRKARELGPKAAPQQFLALNSERSAVLLKLGISPVNVTSPPISCLYPTCAPPTHCMILSDCRSYSELTLHYSMAERQKR